MYDGAMRLVHDHCRCCCSSAAEVCSLVAVVLRVGAIVVTCISAFPRARRRGSISLQCFSRIVTSVTSRMCSHILERPHLILLRLYAFPPRVRMASRNTHSISSLGLVAFRSGRRAFWSQSNFRRLSSRFGQWTAAASIVWPSQELHSPRDCY